MTGLRFTSLQSISRSNLIYDIVQWVFGASLILAKILDSGINGSDKTLEHLSIDFPVL